MQLLSKPRRRSRRSKRRASAESLPLHSLESRTKIRPRPEQGGSRSPNAMTFPGGFAAVDLASSSEKPIHQGSSSHYGEVAGAGVPKLNCTGGGFSAPGCAVKNGRGGKPSMPAIKFV